MNQINYKKRPGKKRFIAGFLVALVLAYTGLAFFKTLPSSLVEASELNITTGVVGELDWPSTGQAAIGTLSDGFLVGKTTETRQPMASITKVVTALALLEKVPLKPGEAGPVYTITQADIDFYRSYVAKYGSVMPINLGQRITQLDALYGMMLPSGNNVADSLVHWIFGDMDSYLVYANDMLQRFGLKDTVVADASGFSPSSQSTPSDLIRLGQKALSDPILSKIVSTKSYDVPGSGPVNNTNFLLSVDPEAAGIKTGNTDEAGSCLLFAFKFGVNNAETFIGVVMGQPNYYRMFSTAQALKNSAMPYFKLSEVLPAGSVVGSIRTAWGTETEIITAESLKVYGWSGRSYVPDISIEPVEGLVEPGQVVGRAEIAGHDETKLIAKQATKGPSIFWRLTNYF